MSVPLDGAARVRRLGRRNVQDGAVEVNGHMFGARQDRLEVALQHARAVAEVQETKLPITR